MSALQGQTVMQCPQLTQLEPGDLVAAVPLHTRVRVFPVDGECFVDLVVLAGLHAAAAQDALVGVIAVEGIALVLLVGLGQEGVGLVLDLQQCCGVVHRTVSVVVIAYRAVQQVVAENAIKAFLLRFPGADTLGNHPAACLHSCGAGAYQFAIYLHKAGVAGLNRTQLLEIADMWDLARRAAEGALQGVDERLTGKSMGLLAIHGDGALGVQAVAWRVGGREHLRGVGTGGRSHGIPFYAKAMQGDSSAGPLRGAHSDAS